MSYNISTLSYRGAKLRSMAKTIETERRDSSEARVPAVASGHAVIVTRYDEEKAVIMNPEDFHRLTALEDALLMATASRVVMSELVLKAHQLEDEPGVAIEDAVEIRALLDL